MFVVCVLYNFMLPLRVWAFVWRSQLVGRIPIELQSAPYHLVLELETQLPSSNPPPADIALPKTLSGGLQG